MSIAASPDSAGGRRLPALRPPFGTVAVTLALLAFWEAASGRLFNAYYLSRPSELALKMLDWAASGYLWPHLLATLATTGLGFALAAVGGVGLALVAASNATLDRVLAPFVFMSFALPKAMLAPVLILWFGVGWLPSLLLSFLTSFFMVFFNAYSGVRSVSPSLLNSVAVMGAGPVTMALKVRLPAALPFVLLGLHQGVIYAFHGAILGEMSASNLGLGYVLLFAATDMDATGVLAALAIVGLLAFALIRLLNTIPGLKAAEGQGS
ncbi:NitT/TauT family transport system permease protein [Azospirillum agricola]|uniref:ABC transporter permease n=1 Tax=Azospirillum agricola TaxID=1720247 RepID=UPI001AE614ED|nr:ABC transporter permease [Azospirillum agricola]MBP2229190.1 NitT/TauT family transport system permease protein [Azospirillum agricola]